MRNQEGQVGRPVKYGDRRETSVRFPPELLARLREAADERDVSANVLINRAVVEFLDRLLPVEEIRWTR